MQKSRLMGNAAQNYPRSRLGAIWQALTRAFHIAMRECRNRMQTIARLERIRRDFVANVSHELKTPVAAIQGLAETLLDDPEMPLATQRRFLEKIRDQTLRLSNLTRDLISLSNFESEGTVIDEGPIDLDGVVREAYAALLGEGEKKSIAMEIALPETPLVVKGDREGLRQSAENLLSNAIRYTPEQGHIGVRVYAEGASAVLEVEDSGIGIESAHLDRIFERFYRVDKARSRELGGTGLGLSIVKHIVMSHGGTISVKSEVGRGSLFRISLPKIS